MVDFAYIERRLYEALEALTSAISDDERAEVTDFIEVSEYGLALETLCAIVSGKHVLLTDGVWETLTELADLMGIRPTTTDTIGHSDPLRRSHD